jgi:hypothetical protein
MTTLAIFEDGTRFAVDHLGNLLVSDRQFPEFALDIINPAGLTELLCNSSLTPELYLNCWTALDAVYA